MSLAVPTLNGLNGASSESKRTKSKNQLRRQKAKQKKAATQVWFIPSHNSAHHQRDSKATPDITVKKEDDHENVEYVSEQLDLKGAALDAFSDVFARFQFDPEDEPVRRPLRTPSLPSHHSTFHPGKIRGPIQGRGHLFRR